MFLVVPVHRLFCVIVFNKRFSKKNLNWLKQFEKIVIIFFHIASYSAKIYRRKLGFLFKPPCLVYTRCPFRSSSVCLGDCPVTNNVRSGEFSAGCAVMTRMPVSMSRPIWNQITRFGTMKLHWSVVEPPPGPPRRVASATYSSGSCSTYYVAIHTLPVQCPSTAGCAKPNGNSLLFGVQR